jgi:hypothetical protein
MDKHAYWITSALLYEQLENTTAMYTSRFICGLYTVFRLNVNHFNIWSHSSQQT